MTDEDKHWFEGQFRTLGAKIEEQFHILDAKIERVETSLLTEFHKWASPVDARLRSHSATLRALDVEMEALTDRVKKLKGEAHGEDSAT